jgi:hypothetical protein
MLTPMNDHGRDERREQGPGNEIADVIGVGDHGAQGRVRGQQLPVAHADAFEVLPQARVRSRVRAAKIAEWSFRRLA